MVDAIPTWAGGEPVGTPERPASVAEYPPVNDRPAPRATTIITEQEQAKVESDLAAARDQQAVKAVETQKEREALLGRSGQGTAAQDKPVEAKSAASASAKPKDKKSPPAN
jgi:hypothetical protein